MKMFTVLGILLFGGFLSLSVGEECMEAKCRLDKEKLESVVALLLSTAGAQITDRLNKESEGQKSASSSPRKTCEITEMPKVNISKYSDDEMVMHISITLEVMLRDPAGLKAEAMMKIKKKITANLAIGKGGLAIKSCSSPSGDADMTVSSPEGLPLPTVAMTPAIKNTMKEVMSVIDDNMCDVVQNVCEGPIGSMMSKMTFLKADDSRFVIRDMKEKNNRISYSMTMSSGEGVPEEERCTASNTTPWEPRCPMDKDAIADVTMKNMAIENYVKNKENKSPRTDSEPGDDRESERHDTSDRFKDAMQSMGLLPEADGMAEIKMHKCEDQTMISIGMPMLYSQE